MNFKGWFSRKQTEGDYRLWPNFHSNYQGMLCTFWITDAHEN